MRKRAYFWLACAILSFVYAISVKCLNTGTNFYLVWIALGLVFLFLFFAAKTGLWRKLPRIARRIVTAMIIIGLIVFLITECFVLSGFGAKGEANLDYIIVLGAQVYENGPSPVLKYRLDTAAAYLKENPDTVCIVSGGQGKNEPFSEAQGMSDYLIGQGIEAERILLEDQSESTIANIRNSMEYIDCENDTVGIVTNNFHVFRATGIAKKQGIAHVYGMSAKANILYIPNNMFREFFGVWKDTVFGNMKW